MNMTDNRHLILEHLVNQAGLAYVETDRYFRIRTWNRGAEILFGYSEDDMVGQPLETAIPMDRKVVVHLKSGEGECRGRLSGMGRDMTCTIFFSRLVDNQGRQAGQALLVRDVIESPRRHNIFNARGQSAEKILGFAPIGVFHVQMGGRMDTANSEFAWMLGYESADQLSGRITDFAGQVFHDEQKAEEFMFILMEAERITRFRCRLKRRDEKTLWALCFAMVTRDKGGRPDGFTGYAIDIGDTVRAETALQQANEELTRLSVLDGLTQIANRRRFDDRLNREWQSHEKSGKPLSVILCDIDYFKKFNDTYGHQAGDECLKEVAAAIDRCSRDAGGMAARYGGEEFGVILPDTADDQAAAVAEKIRNQVLALDIPHENSSVIPKVSLSLGTAAAIPVSGQSEARILASADTMLYRAKGNGRNRVASAS